MSTYSYSVWIDATPNQVWEIYTDPVRIPEWQTGDPRVLNVKGQGSVSGSSYSVKRGPGVSHTTVTQAERPVRHSSRTVAYLGLRFELESDLVGEGRGTRLSLSARTFWPRGLKLLGRLVESALLSSREANRELGRLKVLVEKEAAKNHQ